jgi:allantoicase
MRESFVKRDVWVFVGRVARNMRLMRCEHVDVDVEWLAMVLMLGSHGQADAAAQQIATKTLQALHTVDNRFFDGLGMRNPLERNIDWHAHGLAPVGLVAGVDIDASFLIARFPAP